MPFSNQLVYRQNLTAIRTLDPSCRPPANMKRWPNVGLLLAQRRRRWTNSKPALDQRLLFAGYQT